MGSARGGPFNSGRICRTRMSVVNDAVTRHEISAGRLSAWSFIEPSARSKQSSGLSFAACKLAGCHLDEWGVQHNSLPGKLVHVRGRTAFGLQITPGSQQLAVKTARNSFDGFRRLESQN